jgi:hypothetical protein
MDPKNKQPGLPDLSNTSVGMSDDDTTNPGSNSPIWATSTTPSVGIGAASGTTSGTGKYIGWHNAAGISTGGGLLLSGNSGWADLEEFRGSDDIEDRFIEATAHLTEDDVTRMLDSVKRFSDRSYYKSLINFVSYPNFRTPSEKFLMERFQDVSSGLEVFRTGFRFEMVYGKLLENMPGLKLLIQMRDTDNKDKK